MKRRTSVTDLPALNLQENILKANTKAECNHKGDFRSSHSVRHCEGESSSIRGHRRRYFNTYVLVYATCIRSTVYEDSIQVVVAYDSWFRLLFLSLAAHKK